MALPLGVCVRLLQAPPGAHKRLRLYRCAWGVPPWYCLTVFIPRCQIQSTLAIKSGVSDRQGDNDDRSPPAHCGKN